MIDLRNYKDYIRELVAEQDKAVIDKGEFETLLADMLAATVEQCKHLEYAGRSKAHDN